MIYNLKCNCCGETFTSKGEADMQADGIGGYMPTGGIELESDICPNCGSDATEIIGEEPEDYDPTNVI
jgi:hypothetical protein